MSERVSINNTFPREDGTCATYPPFRRSMMARRYTWNGAASLHYIHCGGRAVSHAKTPANQRSIERCVPCNAPSLAPSQTYA